MDGGGGGRHLWFALDLAWFLERSACTCIRAPPPVGALYSDTQGAGEGAAPRAVSLPALAISPRSCAGRRLLPRAAQRAEARAALPRHAFLEVSLAAYNETYF